VRGPNKSTQPGNKCFLIGHKLKIGPIGFTLVPIRQGGPKKSTPSENKCFLIGCKLKIGPIDFTLEPIRQRGPKKSTPSENKSFLIGHKLKIGPIDFTLEPEPKNPRMWLANYMCLSFVAFELLGFGSWKGGPIHCVITKKRPKFLGLFTQELYH